MANVISASALAILMMQMNSPARLLRIREPNYSVKVEAPDDASGRACLQLLLFPGRHDEHVVDGAQHAHVALGSHIAPDLLYLESKWASPLSELVDERPNFIDNCPRD